MMKTIKALKIKSISVLLLLSLILTACGASDVPAWKLKGLGKKKVLEHFEDVHGVKPKIKNVKRHWSLGPTMGGTLPSLGNMGYSGEVSVTLDIDGETYYADTEADKKDGKVFDDYERDYIREQLIDEIEEQLGIACLGSYFQYKDTSSYGVGELFYNEIHFAYQNANAFYNECHTKIYIGTTDELDEEKLINLTSLYSVDNDLAFLQLNIVRFDESIYVPNEDKDYIYAKYILEDEHVEDYYELIKSSRDSDWKIRHMGEIVE